jgi:protein-L-isoaspartate(D-aspartate) O-methyltransferase
MSWTEKKRVHRSRVGKSHLLFVGLVALLFCNCTSGQTSVEVQQKAEESNAEQADTQQADAETESRRMMVDRQLAARDINDSRVLQVMREVPRHEFVPKRLRGLAYQDSPLPIGADQTISQPYIVALMTQLVEPKSDHKALDVGTGSGYQAAVLSKLVKQVFSIEIIESLATEAGARLQRLGCDNVQVRHGDGYAGWESEAPFDVIIVAAAPDHVPPALVEQLAPGGKLVIPIGDRLQTLVVIEKKADGSIEKHNVAPVAFVPMTGEARK